MPGFPRAEQRFLAALIGGQRHSFKRASFDMLPETWREAGLRLLMILRLAVLLNRSRKKLPRVPVHLRAGADSLSISFDAVKHLVLCRIERRPPKLDLDVYPYLPRATVQTTSAASYMCLTTGDTT